MSCPIYVTITILPKQNKLASISFLYKTLLGSWHAVEQQAGLEPDSAGFPTALVIFKQLALRGDNISTLGSLLSFVRQVASGYALRMLQQFILSEGI